MFPLRANDYRPYRNSRGARLWQAWVSRHERVEIEIIDETDWRIDASKVQQRETLAGAYLVLISPFDRGDGQTGNEVLTKQTLSMYVAMFAALFGRNIVYKRIFDNIVHCATGQITSHSPVIENPFWFPAPDISAPHLKTLQATDTAMASLRENEQHRARLSLRWFESAIFDSGIDGFLKYWIALETLAMPDTTNIRPLNQSLANAYGLSLDETRDRFAIGRLFGLRSRIVHDGLMVGIRGELLTYTEGIYVDVLQHYLGLPCERRAEQVMNSPEFELDDYLPT